MTTDTKVKMGWQMTCASCGIRYTFDADMQNRRFKNGRSFYCPNGHSQVFTEGLEVRELRLEKARSKELLEALEKKQQRLEREKKSHAATKRSHSATKGKLTKHKNRAAAGVCPCCNRTFRQLAAHMKTQHPEFSG